MLAYHFTTVAMNMSLDLVRAAPFFHRLVPGASSFMLADALSGLKLPLAEGRLSLDEKGARWVPFRMECWLFESGIGVADVEYTIEPGDVELLRGGHTFVARPRQVQRGGGTTETTSLQSFVARLADSFIAQNADLIPTNVDQLAVAGHAAMLEAAQQWARSIHDRMGVWLRHPLGLLSYVVSLSQWSTTLVLDEAQALSQPADAEILSEKPGQAWRQPGDIVIATKAATLQDALIDVHGRALTHFVRYISQEALTGLRESAGELRLGEENRAYWVEERKNLEHMVLQALRYRSEMERHIALAEAPAPKVLKRGVLFKDPHPRDAALRGLGDIVKTIRELRSPIDARDQALLQRETEKLNERLLLLTVLALALAVMQLLASPGTGWQEKAGFTVFMVLLWPVYAVIRKRLQRRADRLTRRRYVESLAEKAEREFRQHEDRRNALEEDSLIDEGMRGFLMNNIRENIEQSVKLRDAARRAAEELR